MKSTKSIIAIIAILAIIVFLGWFFFDIMIYMLVALALSFLGKPLMRLLGRIKIKGKPFPVSLAAAITLIVIFMAIFTVIYFLVPVIVREVTSIMAIDPTALNSGFEDWLNQLDPLLKKFGFLDDGEHFSTFVSEEVQRLFQQIDMSNVVRDTMGVAKAFLIGLFSVLFMTFFALKDHGIFFKMLGNWIPTRYRNDFSNILDATGKQLSSYFIGVFIDMLCVGLIEMLLCLIFRVPNAPLIGTIGGLLNIIPFVGPLIAAAAAVVISVTSLIPAAPESAYIVNTIVKVLCIIVATKLLDDFVLQPTIYGKRTQTHPLEIFIVILMAGYVGGIFAMIFAVPAYTILRIVVQVFFGAYFAPEGDEIVADTPSETAEEITK